MLLVASGGREAGRAVNDHLLVLCSRCDGAGLFSTSAGHGSSTPRDTLGSRRRRPLPAVTRLDPSRPLPAMRPNLQGDSSSKANRERALRLSGLEAVLRSGESNKVWKVYSKLMQDRPSGKESIGQTLTPHHCTRVLQVITSHDTRRQEDMHRVLAVIADVRSRRRHIAEEVRRAMGSQDATRLAFLQKELQEWDAVISPTVLNTTISYVGLSLRHAKLSQLDEVFSQLLEAKASSEESEQLQRGQVKLVPPKWDFSQGGKKSLLGVTIPTLLSQKQPYRPPFPDLTTYNTLLEIITRMVHRYTWETNITNLWPDEDGDKMGSMQAELNSLSAGTEYAAITEKMRQLDLDAEAGSITLERAEKLFHAILHRMTHKSRLEPDRVTYNICLTMYSELKRRDLIHNVMTMLRDKNMLTIASINNVLWNAVTQLPTSATERVTAIEEVQEVYSLLRDNLVQREMGSPYPKIHSKKIHKDHETPQNRRSKAVEQILGLDGLAMELVPDQVTYALMVRILTRAGNFSDALGVWKDLAATPKPNSSEHLQPGLPIFESFFRGFSRYGRPSRLVHYDHEKPENSTWTAMKPPDTDNQADDASQKALWNMNTFREIFDSFLRFRPDDSAIKQAGKSSLPQIPSAAEAESNSESLVWVSDRAKKSQKLMTSYGVLMLNEASALERLRQPPSANQLFWILTALRRVSGDNIRWTLAMWQKVHDKFSNVGQGDDVFSWDGYRLDNRLLRVLEFLQAKLDDTK